MTFNPQGAAPVTDGEDISSLLDEALAEAAGRGGGDFVTPNIPKGTRVNGTVVFAKYTTASTGNRGIRIGMKLDDVEAYGDNAVLWGNIWLGKPTGDLEGDEKAKNLASLKRFLSLMVEIGVPSESVRAVGSDFEAFAGLMIGRQVSTVVEVEVYNGQEQSRCGFINGVRGGGSKGSGAANSPAASTPAPSSSFNPAL